MVSAEATVRPVTKACIDDVQNLNLNNERMLRVVKEAILQGKYVNAQWCPTGKPGVWAACDAYKLCWKGNEDKELEKPLYVKFCIGKKGDIMLLISCHPSDR